MPVPTMQLVDFLGLLAKAINRKLLWTKTLFLAIEHVMDMNLVGNRHPFQPLPFQMPIFVGSNWFKIFGFFITSDIGSWHFLHNSPQIKSIGIISLNGLANFCFKVVFNFSYSGDISFLISAKYYGRTASDIIFYQLVKVLVMMIDDSEMKARIHC